MPQETFSQSAQASHEGSQGVSQGRLSSVRIVLVAPAGPLNVGSVARVMKNFGMRQLVLVSPQCDPLGEEAMQMAVHAKDILQAARQVETIPDALVGCYLAIATTARQRGFNAPLERPELVLPTLLTAGSSTQAGAPTQADSSPHQTALLFGPEDRGLSNEELSYAQQFIKIPTDDAYSALNLAQAVAVCCYELHRANLESAIAVPATVPLSVPIPEQKTPNTLRTSPLSAKQSESHLKSNPNQVNPNQANLAAPLTSPGLGAPLNEIEGYYQHLERVLLQIGYLYPHTAYSRMRKFRQLLHRASPTSQEVAMLRGILRQVEWAMSDSAVTDSKVDSEADSRADSKQG